MFSTYKNASAFFRATTKSKRSEIGTKRNQNKYIEIPLQKENVLHCAPYMLNTVQLNQKIDV